MDFCKWTEHGWQVGKAHLQPIGINIIRAHLQIACIKSKCVYWCIPTSSSRSVPFLLFCCVYLCRMWIAHNGNNNNNKICSSSINSKNNALFALMLLLIISAMPKHFCTTYVIYLLYDILLFVFVGMSAHLIQRWAHFLSQSSDIMQATDVNAFSI